MTIFFAHSTDDPTKTDWQPLAAHLTKVAERAGEFSARFGAEQWGWVCGLFHDLGKFSRDFQARLDGGPRVDHSTAGARLAYKRYGPAYGSLIAYAVAGHHAGLPDGGVPGGPRKDTLHGRLDARRVMLPPIMDFESVLDVAPPGLPSPKIGKSGFSVAFFVRMLYSCLVDADFLDTEAWLAQDRAKYREDCYSLEALLGTLNSHLDAICRNDTRINKHRAEILAKCRKAAELPPGIFSLTVPTGGGKTLSSLAFALRHAVLNGMDRVIYAIPYTSIIEQNATVFRSILGEDTVLEHHSNYEAPRDDGEDETVLALRMRLLAENWHAPLVVTTNVQLFQSLFAAR